MVKTRRSNGENGEVEDGNYTINDVGSVSDEKASNWSKRELRSSQYKVTRKIQRWPTKYSRSRLRAIKMPRLVFPESDTEPEKYSRRSRQVRVFFADENDSNNRSMKIRRNRGPRKNYMEESEEKQQNVSDVRRSCRKRKLLHHNFNESWITNELKVKGYPDLYGFPESSSSDDFSSGDEAAVTKKLTRSHGPANTDDDAQRQRRTSARFSNKKDASESDSEEENNQTVIEKKTTEVKKEEETEKPETEDTEIKEEDKKEDDKDKQEDGTSESNQRPVRSTRRRGRRIQKKDDSQQDTGKTFTIRKKPYSLRERKPKSLRRKTIRSQSPSTSSSSTSSSDTEEDLNVSMKNKTKGRQKSKSMDDKTDKALRDIQPIAVDGSVRFSSVGGLEEHIKCLREMVLFPLMYPDLFDKFRTRPARGVLFHGPPGTGKTLLARALANECSLVGGRKVAFFMRKGADCLKKWVGESERHLKLLFQQANKMKPSIIFFDEIDALAPVRSVRQEQVHASVVGTLLAEMDGLTDRGEVIVIGATNRLDAVDPALRRAGRFDRELHFALPAAAARADILRIYTAHWTPPPAQHAIEHIADVTNGYGGSDLKALCSEAVLKALRRVYPQVYNSEHALLIDPRNVEVRLEDMRGAMVGMVAAGARCGPAPARRLPAAATPLLAAQLHAAHALMHAPAPPHERSTESPLALPTLLLLGECADTLLAPALLERTALTVKELSVATLHSAMAFTQEQALLSVFSECRRADGGCVLWVKDARGLWAALGASAPLLPALWRARAAGDATALLATAPLDDELPAQFLEMFPSYKNCVYRVREPHTSEVINFLRPVVTEAPLRPPVIENTEPPPPLPRAPPPPPPRESPTEVARRKRAEDYKLRELRIFLRDICRKLASNRRFYKFTKPVDLEEVTDYLDIIKQPMDLETMMTKVDMHKYNCAKEFLDDIDLICANALEYNPDRTSSDKQIRHEACSLRDHAHALFDAELNSDFEMECREIAQRRKQEGDADNDLPDFIYTASNLPGMNDSQNDSKIQSTQNGEKSETHSAKRKRRRMNPWSKGLVVKRPRTAQKSFTRDTSGITDEEFKENKPITSTPLPNGSCSSGSDDDAPLRPPRSRSPPHSPSPALHPAAHNMAHEMSAKTPEKTPTKTSPKKRNSGQEVSNTDAETVVINKTELDNILYKNAKALRSIGLEALLDLHSQIEAATQTYRYQYDRTKLPQEIQAIVSRYIQHAKK